MAVIINRGQKTYTLSPGGKGETRLLVPGASAEVSEAEAKRLLGYHDIVDAAKAVPENAAEIERLKAENARLKEEQSTLQQGAPEPAAEPEEKEEPAHAHRNKKAVHRKRGR